MTLKVNIKDTFTGNQARVSEYGELVIGSINYSTPNYAQITAPATPTKIVGGIPSKKFVMTAIILASNKNFASSTVAETVTVYEANPADLSVNIETIFRVDLLRNDRVVATGLNLITNTTSSIVGITPTSAEVDITITGYYVPV